MYKASFDTHRVTVLIAVSMTLLLSHDVLALFCFGTLRVESKGLERLGSSSLVRVGAEDPLGYCCLFCCSLSPVALGLVAGLVERHRLLSIGPLQDAVMSAIDHPCLPDSRLLRPMLW